MRILGKSPKKSIIFTVMKLLLYKLIINENCLKNTFKNPTPPTKDSNDDTTLFLIKPFIHQVFTENSL